MFFRKKCFIRIFKSDVSSSEDKFMMELKNTKPGAKQDFAIFFTEILTYHQANRFADMLKGFLEGIFDAGVTIYHD